MQAGYVVLGLPNIRPLLLFPSVGHASQVLRSRNQECKVAIVSLIPCLSAQRPGIRYSYPHTPARSTPSKLSGEAGTPLQCHMTNGADDVSIAGPPPAISSHTRYNPPTGRTDMQHGFKRSCCVTDADLRPLGPAKVSPVRIMIISDGL